MIVEAGRTLSHYRLVEKLGEGGMGVVWKARDLSLDRDVAIKFLPEPFASDPLRLARFERETKAVAALHHPNIVTIHSVEEAEGTHFFTMELVEGEQLSRRIVPGGLNLEPFLRLAVPLADAIAAAHERGIIHRDLKPGNVMVGPDDAVKILDFGLATQRRIDGGAPRADDLTITVPGSGRLSGTIRYMSPEQLRGNPLDHRSDLFSLAVVLFELATGEPPFAGETSSDVIAAILKDPPRSALEINPRLPAELDRILTQCLEKDVRRRMHSAAELRDGLENLGRAGARHDAAVHPSVAVLPFVDMSRDHDQEYFCEGVAEEILNSLSKVPGLRVASRTSSFRENRDPEADSREIGRRLGVATLLEGSVRKAGNRVRITVQLIETARGFHLWSERFDRELTDIFAIQEEIARNVVRALQVTLSAQETQRIGRAPTRHVQAYDYYLRGRKFFDHYGRRDIEFALQLFSRAVELDPGYALAHAGIADCWSYLYLYADRSPTLREQALASSLRAVELDPDAAQAHASLGAARALGTGVEEADQSFETAIRLDPSLFEAWYFYARHSFARGEMEKAARLFEEASRVRPDDYQASLLVGQVYDELRRPDDARAARLRGIALAEARLELHPDDVRALYMGANGLVALGERERGLEWAGRARGLAPRDPMLLYNLGCIYSLAGEPEEALDCLEQAFALGLAQKGWYEHDTDLAPLRSQKRFQALLARMP